MINDSVFQFVGSESVSDGMGGFIETPSIGTSFGCHKTPIKVETALREYGLVTSKAFKLITKEKFNSYESLKLQDKLTDENYKVIDVLDYPETIFTIFLIEKVQ